MNLLQHLGIVHSLSIFKTICDLNLAAQCDEFSIYNFAFFFSSEEELYGVVNDGKFYERHPPQYASDNWLGSATLIGSGDWNSFQFLFFHPDGTLYGVHNDRFYKGPPPKATGTDAAQDWMNTATLVGTGGWHVFQFLFFDPEGTLYGVANGKFYRRAPPTHGSDNWLGSATLVGSGGWQVFQFLFFDPMGMLYGVENGRFHKREPPTHAGDNWLGSATLIGTGGWNHFKLLFFLNDGKLYGVNNDKFYKRTPPVRGNDNWLGSAELIGSGGWSVFKFLMGPLRPPPR